MAVERKPLGMAPIESGAVHEPQGLAHIVVFNEGSDLFAPAINTLGFEIATSLRRSRSIQQDERGAG